MTPKHIIPICLLALNAGTLTAQIAPTDVVHDYETRIKEIGATNSVKIPDNLSDDQRQCLQFLYAYMPLPDFTDRTPQYYLNEVVNPALLARKEMPWGAKVPDREFRHFVLPVRVNNEALDNHRKKFYDELKDRVKGMSMKDAILEINHWCHEKVTYQPSDSRTHSPLQSVSSAIGRCGEESTFTVAALRAMGIPARQVYTPRWAHTDDNHAWVEAWADGQWYFLGACEPEPVLNLGWFNSPASRGMLMHARVFGKYSGEEEILNVLHGNTDINVTDHYAPVDTLHVTVTDTDNNPVNNAKVSFRVYNYAEFYPISTKRTDISGTTSLVSGLGDLIVWATDGTKYGFKKASVGKDKNIIVPLNLQDDEMCAIFDIVPPKASNNSVEVSDEMREENNRRMAYEDSIRHSYTATFITKSQSDSMATKWALDSDRVWNVMKETRGNHRTITGFLDNTPDKYKALCLLESLTKKDLSDVPYDILIDHISTPEHGGDLFAKYVMSPRIEVEELTPFRKFLTENIPVTLLDSSRDNPELWVKWTKENIIADLDWYPSQITMSPASVWKYRRTSPYSRDIFFVAGARTMGISARLDPVTGKTQWADNSGTWHDANFYSDDDIAPSANLGTQGSLIMPYAPTRTIPDPKYYTHFTVSKIDSGEPQLLSYPDFIAWSETFKNPQTLDTGLYMVTTGQRMADGSVLARTDILDIKSGIESVDTLTIRQDSTGIQVIGSFDAESRYMPKNSDSEKSVLATTGRGYYVLGLIKPNHEPTNHALRDIAAYDNDLNNWGRSIVLLYDSPEEAARMDMSQLPELPSTVVFGNDIDGTIAKRVKEGLNITSNDYPIFIIADTFNRVVFVSQGYTIGLGQKIIDTVSRLE